MLVHTAKDRSLANVRLLLSFSRLSCIDVGNLVLLCILLQAGKFEWEVSILPICKRTDLLCTVTFLWQDSQ